MKNDNALSLAVGVLIGVALMGVLLWATGSSHRQVTQKWEREAISRGNGEYTVNAETREVSFRWK